MNDEINTSEKEVDTAEESVDTVDTAVTDVVNEAIADTPVECADTAENDGETSESEQDATQEDCNDACEEEPQKGILGEYEDKKSAKKAKKQKKELTPEQKKKRTIKALIITGAVVLAIAIFFSGCAIATAVSVNALLEQAQNNFDKVEYTEHTQLVPTYDDSLGYWTFTKEADRDFKVVQLTDVHIGGGGFSGQKDSWAMNAVATMIRQEQPDLVVVTGDIAYPVPFQAGTFNNLNATKIFANLMESLEVYWTFAFGNHDTELYSLYDRKQISEWYEDEGFEHCLFRAGYSDSKDKISDTSKGFGNDMIVIKNPDGALNPINQAIVTFDSHSYTDGDYFGIAWKYDNIHQCQIDWYTQEMDKLKTANGGVEVNNLAFFHIPLEEYREAWANVILADKSASDVHSGDVIVGDGSKTTFIYGNMGESDKKKNGVRTFGVFCGSDSDNLFEEGLKHGLQGIFCGHDHYNNFSVVYQRDGDERGIRLTYGMAVDYLAYPGIYKEHAQRGCTVITINASGEFDCEARNYYTHYGVKHEKD